MPARSLDAMRWGEENSASVQLGLLESGLDAAWLGEGALCISIRVVSESKEPGPISVVTGSVSFRTNISASVDFASLSRICLSGAFARLGRDLKENRGEGEGEKEWLRGAQREVPRRERDSHVTRCVGCVRGPVWSRGQPDQHRDQHSLDAPSVLPSSLPCLITFTAFPPVVTL